MAIKKKGWHTKPPSTRAQQVFANEQQVRVHLSKLVSKLEQTVPFPYPVQEFYESLLPEEFLRQLGEPPYGTQHMNLQRAVTRHNVIHVELDPDSFFRIVMPHEVPAPFVGYSRPFAAFVLTMQTPHYASVHDWFDAAQKLDWKLQAMHRQMKDTLKEGPAVVSSWPNFAKVIRSPHGRPTRKAMDDLDLIVTSEQRDEYDALLAQAVLLPELALPHVWISHND